jgi:hypothetical protein
MKKINNKKIASCQKDTVNFLSFLKISDFTFPSLYSEKYFEWKISHNPFGKSFCYLRCVEDEPVAIASITAKPLNKNLELGDFLAELGDTHTHPNFQKQGHFGQVGSQVIADFNKHSNDTALIFGIPNENAVHGWQSRCGCQLLESLNINEYVLKHTFSYRISITSSLKELRSDINVMKLVNLVWQKSYKNRTALIQKNSDWWRWRYDQSTESYRTFSLRCDKQLENVYLVAKISNKSIFSYIDICDIVGETEDLELDILKEFIKKFKSPFTKIRVWAKVGSKVNSLLEKYKFSFSRKINFVLFKNTGYKALREKQLNFTLDLGDTDNT